MAKKKDRQAVKTTETAGVRRPVVIAALLFLLAAALRLYRLDQGFDYDEIFATTRLFRASWGTLFTVMPAPNHHPLYSLLGKICLMVFGEREWAVRLPAFLFGAATAPLLYLAGRRWLCERTGLLAALFWSLAVWPVWSSQSARGCSAAVFLTLLATHLFLVLRERLRWPAAALYVAVAAAAVYTHLYAGAVVGALFLIGLALLARPADRRAGALLAALCAAALVLALLLYIPLIPDLVEYTHEYGRHTEGRSISFSFPGRILLSFAVEGRHRLWAVLLLVPAALGLWIVLRKRPLLGAVWLLSLAIGIAAPAAASTFVYPRFYLYLLPGLYLFLAAGLGWVMDRLGKTPVPVRLLLALPVVAVMVSGLPAYYRAGHSGLKASAEWVRSHAAGAKVLTLGLPAHEIAYYHRKAAKLPPEYWLVPAMPTLDDAVVLTAQECKEPAIRHRCERAAVFESGAPTSDIVPKGIWIYRCR